MTTLAGVEAWAEDVALAPKTTLSVGGRAKRWVCAQDAAQVRAALEVARAAGEPVWVLGGGSNVLVSDAGWAGMVLQVTARGVEVVEDDGARVIVRVGAGEVWDDVVAWAVSEGLAGVECLSGIPGWVGAAPIQNVGAYGQEVSETLVAVEAVERSTGRVVRLEADACGLAYRWSHFKGAWRGRYIITAAHFALRRDRAGTVAYPDVIQRIGLASSDGAPPSLAQIRAHVLEIRRSKSMVYDTDDPNHRSAGSFFVNPIVPAAQAAEARTRIAARLGAEVQIPSWPVDEGQRVKFAAAWLIERAGFGKGHRAGRAGLSTRHCLALINRGGATADELLALATTIRDGVEAAFGIRLIPEPELVGFAPEVRARFGREG